jgi:hypothetical protein
MSKLTDFLEARHPNTLWVDRGECEVYLRKQVKHLDGMLHPVICISNMHVYHGSEDSPRKGHFKNLLADLVDWIDHQSTVKHVYVENVINPHLEAYLVREQWMIEPCTFGSVNSYWKKVAI